MNPMVETAPKVSNQSVGDNEFSVEQPFVHMHIPKTAGTSLRRIFEAEFGAEKVHLLNHETGNVLRADQRKLAVPNHLLRPYAVARRVVEKVGLMGAVSRSLDKQRQQEAIEAGHSLQSAADFNFRTISGHFTADDIREAGLDELPVITVVRHPLDRAISSYKHWQRARSRILALSSIEVSFEEDALAPEQHNYQTRWIDGLSLERIGTTEQLHEFLGSIGMHLAGDQILRSNEDPTPEKRPGIDPGFLREFEAVNREDYDLYYRTYEAWS
jgi:hypothetical protein